MNLRFLLPVAEQGQEFSVILQRGVVGETLLRGFARLVQILALCPAPPTRPARLSLAGRTPGRGNSPSSTATRDLLTSWESRSSTSKVSLRVQRGIQRIAGRVERRRDNEQARILVNAISLRLCGGEAAYPFKAGENGSGLRSRAWPGQSSRLWRFPVGQSGGVAGCA